MNGHFPERQTLKKELAFFFGFGITGTALLGFSAVSIYKFIESIMCRDLVVIWNEASWIALPTSIAFLALSLCFYIGRHDGPNVSGRLSEMIKYLLEFTMCVLPFVIILPFGTHWITAAHLEARGYTERKGHFWTLNG